jgi:hypothetical protein
MMHIQCIMQLQYNVRMSVCSNHFQYNIVIKKVGYKFKNIDKLLFNISNQ